MIGDYVVKERVAPVTVKGRLSVGATLPADVELRTVPGAWGPRLAKYRYVYSDDHVYLVEPSDRPGDSDHRIVASSDPHGN